jgi:spore coat protein CotF
MLQDKEMVNDALSAAKSELTGYANVISECSNQQLRSTIQQIRDNSENSQYELYQLASSKGFYTPASQASDSEIQEVRSQSQQPTKAF